MGIETSVKKDNSIMICRIVGMLFIVICHIGTYFDSGIVGQFFQYGVQIFLFISGYLYFQCGFR